MPKQNQLQFDVPPDRAQSRKMKEYQEIRERDKRARDFMERFGLAFDEAWAMTFKDLPASLLGR